MNDRLEVTLLAVAAAALGAWLWVERRRVRRLLSKLFEARGRRDAPAARAEEPAPWSSFDGRLFVAALVLFAATRLIGIEDFPIYFFTDEAANTALAGEFVQNGLRDASGQRFPLYFANTEKLSLGVSVYAQLIPYLLFGASVAVTRATSALIALSGAAAVGLILKNIFRLRLAWLGVLLLVITPAWFLHSRTAFETTLYVSLFAWFLYFYLRYRSGHVRAIIPAVIFGALAFYAYNTGQAGLVLCALFLVVADARYHWENRRMALIGAALAAVLAIPYLRFQADHPGEFVRRLQLVDSYLVRPDLQPLEKAARFVEEYAAGLSPAYWFAPDNARDLIRHQMKGYGNLPWAMLPFAVIGLAVCFRRWRDPAHRAVLIAALTAPVGAAMAGVLVTRALVFVVPVVLLTVLGVAAALRWLPSGIPIGIRPALSSAIGDRLGYARVAAALFVLLSLVGGLMTWDALTNGPTWYSDYGLAGMQYGARQVFAAVEDYLSENPESQAWMFPSAWNGSDMLRRFFAPGDRRVLLLDLDSFLSERFDGVEQAVVVLGEDDFQRVTQSGKFEEAQIEAIVPLPDGRPGFYLARLEYAPQAEAIFAAEHLARDRMVQEEVILSGQRVVTRHTPLAEGAIQDLFDGDPSTLVRTAGANPAVVELDFPQPLWLDGLTLTTGSMDLGLVIRTLAGEGTVPGRYAASFTDLPPDPTVGIVFDPPPGSVAGLRIEMRDLNGLTITPVHIREIVLRLDASR